MSVAEIESAIVQLPAKDFAELMAWLQKYHEQFRDEQIAEGQQSSLDDVYAILGRRYASGEHDVAARHDEHQP